MNLEFIQRIITNFLTLMPIFDFVKARIGIATVADISTSITPLAILVNRYGLFKPALLCAIVEVFALAVSFYTCGIDEAVTRTIPLLEARSKVIFFAAYASIFTRLSHLGSKAIAYARSTAVAQTVTLFHRPALLSAHIIHHIITFFFGELYLASTIIYFENLPRRLCDYARRQGKEKILYPGKRIIGKTRSEYPFLAFAYRAVFLSFAAAVFFISVPIAFLYLYALDVGSVLIHTDEAYSQAFVEEVSFEEADSVRDGTTTLRFASDDSSSGVLSTAVGSEEGQDDTSCGTAKASSDGGVEGVQEVVHEEKVESVVMEQVKDQKVLHWFEDDEDVFEECEEHEDVQVVLEQETRKVEDAKKVDAPKQPEEVVGKTSRLTPFAVPFVPKFSRTRQAAPAPAHAPVMPVYRVPIVFRPSLPTRSASVDWAPTFTSLPRMPAAPIPTSRSMPPTHWAPALIVPVVLEVPKRRGDKEIKSGDGVEPVKRGLSRKERHRKLMGVRAKESAT
ncbi:hypothetical protein CPC08DRAFT_447718 [Agrocybe pediades]|nr:hypothetical protein CPC08DRAFT_447718 [Agrocybe pediades]